MQRFLKRRADEDVDFNRDAGTHAQVPLGKRGSLLRYIFISRSASMEVDAIDKPTSKEKQGLLRYMSTLCSARTGEAAAANKTVARKKNLRHKAGTVSTAKNDTLLRFMSTAGSATIGKNVLARNAPGKVNGLLRYMTTSTIRAVEVGNAGREASASMKKIRDKATALITATGCSQAVAAKHLRTNYANLIGVRCRQAHILDFPD